MAKKILLIEDDEKTATAIRTRLHANGYEVALAYDAESGARKFYSQQPDLVLMDISIPGGSGISLTEFFRRGPSRNTPVIYLTAHKLPFLRKRAEMTQPAGYIEKPFRGEELIAAIQRSLEPSNGDQIPEAG